MGRRPCQQYWFCGAAALRKPAPRRCCKVHGSPLAVAHADHESFALQGLLVNMLNSVHEHATFLSATPYRGFTKVRYVYQWLQCLFSLYGTAEQPV